MKQTAKPTWITRIKNYRPDVSTLLLLAVLVYFWFRPPAWVSEQSKVPPGFTVELTNGQRVTSDDLRGKVVLVNFWATWCPFCRHEMPAMEKFYDDFKQEGFEILAISIEHDAAPVAQFMVKEGYSFPAALTNQTIAQAFGTVNRVPTSFILDKRGVIRHKITGQVHYSRLRDLIVPLIEE